MNYNNVIGTIGVAIILIAYFANTFNLIEKDGKLYFAANTLGAALACFASMLIHFIPFVILEGTWTLVSLFALLYRIWKN
ncbi:MAG: hypothetical protein ABJA79_08630 [Parafilimonas sp.]